MRTIMMGRQKFRERFRVMLSLVPKDDSRHRSGYGYHQPVILLAHGSSVSQTPGTFKIVYDTSTLHMQTERSDNFAISLPYLRQSFAPP